MNFIKYIADESHYKEVLSLVGKAKQTVWIGTADIKDLYVDDKPFLALIASLLKKGVEVRLIHAKEPGTAWREDHEKHPILYDGMERVLCPRVHFKLIIIDSTIAYVGSANLTGAGMGMKSPKKRNFEAGILTDDPEMLEAAIEQFDNVWIGKFCKDCGRRDPSLLRCWIRLRMSPSVLHDQMEALTEYLCLWFVLTTKLSTSIVLWKEKNWTV